ncbi:MAG: histidine phosphatase family protein [Coriobacteriia bacterium]|nr:histidine phosphatase family protein [Coriobacteriia bacterium]
MGEPTILVTVRHGATDFNRQKRYAGFLDVPLNAEGLADAARASQQLGLSVDVVVSSTLCRAVETARLLTGGARDIVTSELCKERDFGAMQGLASGETEALRPVIKYFRIGGDFHSLNPPGGETLPALRKRAARFRAYVMSQFAGRTVLIVSHEVFLLQFHGLLRGETWQQAMSHTLPNLTLTTMTMQGHRLLSETARPLVEAE